MFTRLNVPIVFSFMVLFLIYHPCTGQGFSNDNQGTKALGQGNAFTARASDPSAIWFNPAGMTQLKGTHFYLGGNGLTHNPSYFSQEYNETYHSDNGFLISPHFYLSHQFSKNLWAGLGFSTPINYLQNWGDDPLNNSVRTCDTFKLASYIFSPCMAFKINESISIGLGVHYLMSNIEIILWDRQEIENLARERLGETITDYYLRSIYSLSGNGLAFFGGIQARLSDAVIFGFSYQGGKDMETKGTLDYEHESTKYPSLDPLVQLGFPDGDITSQGSTAVHQFTFGLALVLGLKFEFEVNYNYKLWSQLEKWPYVLSNPVIDEDLEYYDEGGIPWYWRNSGCLRFGSEFHVNDSLDLRAGLSVSQSPIPGESLTLVVPDSNNTGIHLGLGYRINKLSIDIAYAYRFYGERANEIPNWESYGILVKKTQGSIFGISLGLEL
ncbi:MAG: outer membrane protein transport protein [Candidatus Aminicenantes bacterium]|nr:outer membrane protein transport protein [Candidatus Aminicenantes bacterium]